MFFNDIFPMPAIIESF